MLTVKFMKAPPASSPDVVQTPSMHGCFSTKILQATEVDIHVIHPGELYEVAGTRDDGKSFAFYIADRNKPRPEGFALEVDFWFSAYIENSAGATTEAVRF